MSLFFLYVPAVPAPPSPSTMNDLPVRGSLVGPGIGAGPSIVSAVGYRRKPAGNHYGLVGRWVGSTVEAVKLRCYVVTCSRHG